MFLVLMCFIMMLISFSFLVCITRGQPYYDAWFTHIYVTNGNDQIDLVSGGTAIVYDNQEAAKRLVFYNSGCGTFGADLYTRVYRDGVLQTTSSETHVSKGSSDTDEFSSILSGPAIYSYKVELWWENWGQHLLVDEKEFKIKVVKLSVSNWSASLLSIERGFESGDLPITFANGGNDYMYNVNVTVVDSAGLIVTPLTQSLGTISENGTKTAIFSVQASRDKAPKNYTLAFDVAYSDLRTTIHTETFQVNIAVASNPIRENLNYIIIAILVVTLCSGASLFYIRKRRRKSPIS